LKPEKSTAMKNNPEFELNLVTFEQAKRLKAAGFDWFAPAWYHPNGEDLFPGTHLNHSQTEAFSAPTVALALKWMRDVKGMLYEIKISEGHLRGGVLADEHWRFTPYYERWDRVESALLYKLLTIIESH
jgi:hypothetical protein